MRTFLEEKEIGEGLSLKIQHERTGIVIYLSSEDYSEKITLTPEQWYNFADATNEANQTLKELRAARFTENGMGSIRFSESICYKCNHFNDDGQSCKAFSEAIPVEIKHTEPYKGDNGIQFELNEALGREQKFY